MTPEAALARLAGENALGQLRERRGRMAELATEGGDVKLDWVDQLAWLRAHPDRIDAVERLVADLRDAGIRHVIWAGMGGSVGAIHALRRCGVFEGAPIAVHPLDSTDPAALNRVLAAVEDGGPPGPALAGTAIVAVAMGMTSEEPITHLEWFDGLLHEHGVADPAAHVVVMALPGSLLDAFAERSGARRLPIQADGQSHIAGRMSAPSTHVFLLSAAIALGGEGLREVVERTDRVPTLDDEFVHLAVWLHSHMHHGRDMALLDLPPRLEGLGPWVEQVVEESLGKGGRGLLVFHGQDADAAATWPDRYVVLTVGTGAGAVPAGRPATTIGFDAGEGRLDLLVAIARFFDGWNLAVALLGYLEGIVFAGQPAVEGYKRYARELRERQGPLPFPEQGLVPSADGRVVVAPDSLTAGGTDVAALRQRARALGGGPAAVLAAAIAMQSERDRLGYLDVTLNAEPEGRLWDALGRHLAHLAGDVLRRPSKLRSGPRDYHSTEQSETDGPPDLLSVRILVRDVEPVTEGRYTARFLHAQALGTVTAMCDAHRSVLLVMLRSREDVDAIEALFQDAARMLRGALAPDPT